MSTFLGRVVEMFNKLILNQRPENINIVALQRHSCHGQEEEAIEKRTTKQMVRASGYQRNWSYYFCTR